MIITVTLTPTLERTLVVHYLGVGYTNETQGPVRLDPAGRGINIARALHRLNCPVQSLILLGNDSVGEVYAGLLTEEAFDVMVVPTKTYTRSCTVIWDDKNQLETRLVGTDPRLDQANIVALGEALAQQVKAGDMVVLAGDLPYGVEPDSFAYLTDVVQAIGAKVALATNGYALRDALKAEPDLVVLDQGSAEAYFNYPIRSYEDLLTSAHHLREAGSQQVLIFVKTKGIAVLVDADEQWMVEFPESDCSGTSSGVWDAMVAGYLAGRAKRRPLGEALELGAAAATFATMQIGNEFGTLKELKTYLDDVDVISIDNADHPA